MNLFTPFFPPICRVPSDFPSAIELANIRKLLYKHLHVYARNMCPRQFRKQNLPSPAGVELEAVTLEVNGEIFRDWGDKQLCAGWPA